MQYAVVKLDDNSITNLIEWDGVTPYDPGIGFTLVQTEVLKINDIFTDASLTAVEEEHSVDVAKPGLFTRMFNWFISKVAPSNDTTRTVL